MEPCEGEKHEMEITYEIRTAKTGIHQQYTSAVAQRLKRTTTFKKGLAGKKEGIVVPVTMKMGWERGVGRPWRPYRNPSAARILRETPDAA